MCQTLYNFSDLEIELETTILIFCYMSFARSFYHDNHQKMLLHKDKMSLKEI